jgi:hypothetical protein
MSIKKSHVEFINFLKLNNKKPSYEKNPEQKRLLSDVSLYEKNTDEEIYNWKSLFNPSIPLSKYTQIKKPLKKKIVMIDEETQKNDEDLKKFPNPVLLVDLDDKNFKKFFKKESSLKETDVNLLRCKNINNNNINKKESFYFSNSFNDYYKEHLKTFAKKFPLLKAKFELNSNKLKRSLIDKKFENKEKILNNIINSDSLKIKKQELIIAGKSDNPFPLLKSIYKQTHPDYNENKKILSYKNIVFKTQNNNFNFNIKKNIKTKKNNKSYNEPFNEIYEITQLECSTYNEDDPDLNIFKDKKFFSRNLSSNNNNKNNYNNNLKNENISSTSNINLTTIISSNNSKQMFKNNLQRPFTSQKIKNNLKVINNDVRPLTTKNNNRNSNDFEYNIISNNNLNSVDIKHDSFPVKSNNNNFIKNNKKIKKIKEKNKLLSNIKLEFNFLNDNNNNDPKQRPLTSFRMKTKNNNNNEEVFKENNNNNIKTKNERYKFNFSNYYFNDYIDTVFKNEPNKIKIKDEQNYYYPLNIYNKNNQKWFSASNNIYIRNKKPFINLNTYNYYNNYYKKKLDINLNGLTVVPTIKDSEKRLNSAN